MYIITILYERRIVRQFYCFFYAIPDPSIEWICKRDIIYDAESLIQYPNILFLIQKVLIK